MTERNQAEQVVRVDEDEQRAQERRVAACGGPDDALEQVVQSAQQHLGGHLAAAGLAGVQAFGQPDEEGSVLKKVLGGF